MQTIGQPRFESLINGVSVAPYDQPLLDRGEWLVVPTLGAVVPGWLLAIPRRKMLSFRDWEAADGYSVASVLADLTSRLGLELNEVVWFEHGPAQGGSVVGCGLDHAHLHILLRPRFSFDAFADCARKSVQLGWSDVPASKCYAGLAPTASYLVAGSGDHAIRAESVELAGSQFFRRVVANLAGDEMGWNYRTTAHMGNIERTIEAFKQLESAAQRGI